MRRSLALTVVSLVALLALGGSALAAIPRPVISSVSPTQARIGQTLTLKGKNFAKGARVYFRRVLQNQRRSWRIHRSAARRQHYR